MSKFHRISAEELLSSFSSKELSELIEKSFEEYEVPYEKSATTKKDLKLVEEAIDSFVEKELILAMEKLIYNCSFSLRTSFKRLG